MQYKVKPVCLGQSEADQSGFTYMPSLVHQLF